MPHRTPRTAGFTLVELMVALTISGIVIGAMYTIGSASSRNFQVQHQAANMQAALRLAMLQVQRDIMRAGYLSAPRADLSQCADSTMSRNPMFGGDGWIAGISSFRNDTSIPQFVTDIQINANNGFVNDEITLIGNYATSNEYVISGIDALGSSVFISANPNDQMHATQVDFGWDASGQASPVINQALVQRAFPMDGLIRIESKNGDRQFVRINTNTVVTGNQIVLGFTPALAGDCRLQALGGRVAPLQVIHYGAGLSAGGAQSDRIGAIPQLVRSQRRPNAKDTVMPNVAARVVLEYLAAFDLSFTMTALTPPGAEDNYLIGTSADNTNLENLVNATPERIRAVTVTLAVRAPSSDPGMRSFNCQNLRCFLIDNVAGPGGPAARVRVLRSEIFLPNIAFEGR